MVTRGPAPDDAPSSEVPVAAAADRPKGGGRERWLDLLRAVALLRVVTYHAFGGGWMSMVFPSMGVMFALGGSLMVQSLRRGEALDVIGHRLRRLLPPLWFFGLLAVPVMLWHGWAAQDADGTVERGGQTAREASRGERVATDVEEGRGGADRRHAERLGEDGGDAVLEVVGGGGVLLDP